MQHYRNITWQLVFSYGSTITRMALSFFLFAVLTRALDKAEYGVLSLLFTTIVLVSKYLVLGLPEYIVKEYARDYKKRAQHMSELFTFHLLLLIVLYGIARMMLPWVLDMFNLVQYGSVVGQAVLIGAVVPVHIILTSYLVAVRKIRTSETISTFATLWMAILLVLFALGWSFDLGMVFGIRLQVEVIVALFALGLLFVQDGVGIVLPRWETVRRGLVFGLPLLPLYASEYFITAIDRYFIGFYSGSEALGGYAYYYSLLSFLVAMSVIPINMLFSYAASVKDNKKKSMFYFNASLKYALMLLFPALVGLYVMREPIVTLISGPKYLSDLWILGVLLAFPLFEVVSTQLRKIGLLHSKSTQLTWVYLISGALNILLNFLLVPAYGVLGACIATIVTYVVLAGLLYKLTAAHLEVQYHFLRADRILVSSLLMGLIVGIYVPSVMVEKLLWIGIGVLVYGAGLFMFGAFTQDEKKLIASFYRRQ